ncbi:MAG: DNA polymerase III subunit delta, partial [Ilumatobacteraceae bacterium]
MSIHLLTGDDESNLRAAVTELVHELVGDADRSLMVDEFDGAEYTLREVVDSAQTPPFLTESRVVVARGIGRFVAADIDVMKAYLADPLPTTHLVLVGGGGAVTKPLLDAVKSAGGSTRSTSVSTRGRDLETWVRSRLEVKGLHFDQPALTRLLDWLGENTSTLDGLLDTVAAAHSGRSKVQLAELEPLLGEEGGVPPWDLTDAIDGGDVVRSITLLHRMMHGGGRH